MRKLFIGKPLHWLMIAAATGGMYWLGAGQFHRVNYSGFLFLVLGIAVACVALVIITYRRGDRITRESLDSAPKDKIVD